MVRFQFTPLREGRRSVSPEIPERIISIHAPPRGATAAAGPPHFGRIAFQFTPLREGRHGGFYHRHRRHDISIHAPPRGATDGGVARRNRRVISIHAPPRGATSVSTLPSSSLIISIHAPPRGATARCSQPYCDVLISIHAPPRGATARTAKSATPCVFQFTPLREGRLFLLRIFVICNLISIHAPPRGATKPACPHGCRPAHFNSRPSARGDHMELLRGEQSRVFQFTPLREGRQHGVPKSSLSELFQFTPLREGRRTRIAIPAVRSNFNSRPSARGDKGGQRQGGGDRFQFTPLREGRLCRKGTFWGAVRYFNSRPSARGDPACLVAGGEGSISIHAPPRGATEWADFTGDFFRISIHAPPRGATTRSARPRGSHFAFQFTPLREGRLWRLLAALAALAFQFTPLREGRREVADIRHRNRDISIHAPPRGATRRRPTTTREDENFNSRPSARGDGAGRIAGPMSKDFNSRPSARGDLVARFLCLRHPYFNSRPSARGDSAA